MSIPDFQTLMLPLLQYANDGAEHTFREAVEHLATLFSLTDEERAEQIPSGTQGLFTNRVGWTRTYLKMAGLLISPKRGCFKITDQGSALLAERPERIDNSVLERYVAFRSFKSRKLDAGELEVSPRGGNSQPDHLPSETPEDLLAAAYQQIRRNLEEELLDQIKSSSPAFFERLVIDLLVTMGYGGSRQDAGKAIGRSGDGGIDGIIKEDKLGLDVIYIQAKRWEGTVGRPEIQKFAGALQGQRANKGVFITTSTYSRDAAEYAGAINTKIILIDGNRLASLMVDHNVAVTPVGMYELKKIDSDYFEGE